MVIKSHIIKAQSPCEYPSTCIVLIAPLNWFSTNPLYSLPCMIHSSQCCHHSFIYISIYLSIHPFFFISAYMQSSSNNYKYLTYKPFTIWSQPLISDWQRVLNHHLLIFLLTFYFHCCDLVVSHLQFEPPRKSNLSVNHRLILLRGFYSCIL